MFKTCRIFVFSEQIGHQYGNLLVNPPPALSQCQVRNRSLCIELEIKKDLIKSPTEPSLNLMSTSIKYGYANKICILCRPQCYGNGPKFGAQFIIYVGL